MQNILRSLIIGLPIAVLAGCTTEKANDNHPTSESEEETVTSVVSSHSSVGDDLVIQDEPCCANLLYDTDGDVNHSARGLFNKNENVVFHYQRVGCNSDTCKQEFVTYAAVQYPKDSILQCWVADILGNFFSDATCQLDILVNGAQIEYNDDGEMVTCNTGCRPYDGVLGDGGKAMFDYYQAREWVIGKNRDNVHGPGGRYGCAIYRCWQSSRFASYFVAYSTDEPQWPVHYVCSFDRKTGQKLDITDLIREDCLADLNDLVVEAARERHYRLLHNKRNELAIETGECDYSSMIDIKEIGFTAEGLAVSTGALPFDQWPFDTHILILPYAKVNILLQDSYRR